MQPAVEGLEGTVARLKFKDPNIPIIANVSAQPLNSAPDIKAELILQLSHSVMWQHSVEYMLDKGISTFIEIGSGNVLSGLIKRINKNVKTLNIGSTGELGNILNP